MTDQERFAVIFKDEDRSRDNVIEQMYQGEVINTIRRHTVRLMDEGFKGEMRITFNQGRVLWVEIKSE